MTQALETAATQFEYCFDIETDGFKPTKIHSLVIIHVADGEVFSCCDQPGYPSIADGIALLEAADTVIGHNILAYDVPWLRKLRGAQIAREAMFDTLTACRMQWPDVRDADGQLTGFPTNLIGRHSLEAWGHRLGLRKGSFGKTTNWQTWTPQMQEYCVQDTQVALGLYFHLLGSV